MELSREVAEKVLRTVDAGLVKGVGVAEPGKMCVEAAVCFALGLPHGDDPKCVGTAVRRFKIRLNDAAWSSDAARTKGLRKLSVAQLGSNDIDQKEFSRLVVEQTIRQIVPYALRAAAKRNPKHAENLEAAAQRCEVEGTRDAALNARAAADAAAAAYAYAADAYAAAYAADAYAAAYAAAAYAAAAADAAAYAAAYAADAYAAADAADAAAYAADAYAAAYAADAYAAAYAHERDNVLTMMSEIGLRALITLKSPGCEWLDLCE